MALGVVTKPHGVRGAVRVKAFNASTELFTRGRVLWLARPRDEAPAVKPLAGARGGDRFERVVVRAVSGGRDGLFVLELEGDAVGTTVDELEALRGAELWVDRDAMPPLEPGEFYHCDLPGCAVLDGDGVRRGEVVDVVAYPSVDAIVVQRAGRETLEVPVVDGIVLRVDVAAREVQVDFAALEGDDGPQPGPKAPREG